MKKMYLYIREHLYCCAMLYLLFYLAVFFTLDHVIRPRYIIHCPLDDRIPFCEYFAVFYFIWFFAFTGALVYFMFKSPWDFEQLWFIMFTGMNICFLVYILLPNGLDLRPAQLERQNLFTWMMHLVWTADASVNVCPSIHVSSSAAVAAVTLRSHLFRKRPVLRGGIVLLMALICISTLFVKQHSVIDVLAGLVLTLLLDLAAYHTGWRKLFYRLRLGFLVDSPKP